MTRSHHDYVRPIVVAIVLMAGAEFFYLFVFGVALFPDGPFIGKLIWTLTCGVAMGSVVAALTIMLVIGRLAGPPALFASGLTFAVVGIYCAFLCSAIDAKFNYFGGREHGSLFVLLGVIPAFAGGLFYGWLLYSAPGRSILQRLGI